MDVTFGRAMHAGEINALSKWERFGKEPGATDDEALIHASGRCALFCQGDSFLQASNKVDALRCLDTICACDNNRIAAVERFTDGLEGVPPHDDGVPHGKLAEAL